MIQGNKFTLFKSCHINQSDAKALYYTNNVRDTKEPLFQSRNSDTISSFFTRSIFPDHRNFLHFSLNKAGHKFGSHVNGPN